MGMKIKIMIIMMMMTLVLILMMTVLGLRGTTGATSIPGNAVKAAREAKRNQCQDARMKAHTAEPLRNLCAKTTQTNARKHVESAGERERNLFQDVRMKMIIANPIKNSCARTTPTNARKRAESALEMGGKLSSC